MTAHATPSSANGPEKGSTDADAGAAESFGRYLVRERELRGMSLAQIADQTRINASNLRALEQDDLSRLPARVFVLGHIRAYAQAIGLNQDDAVLRFEEYLQRSAPPEDEEQSRRPRRRRALGVVIALAAAAVAAGLWFFLQR